jgi:hypothetical protein
MRSRLLELSFIPNSGQGAPRIPFDDLVVIIAGLPGLRTHVYDTTDLDAHRAAIAWVLKNVTSEVNLASLESMSCDDEVHCESLLASHTTDVVQVSS